MTELPNRIKDNVTVFFFFLVRSDGSLFLLESQMDSDFIWKKKILINILFLA